MITSFLIENTSQVVTVYDLAVERIADIITNFDHTYVAFSGGKDSGVLLHLTLDWAQQHNMLSKISVMHIDYEIQYSETIAYVDTTLHRVRELGIRVDRICLPLVTPCCTSMFEDYWRPWDEDKKDLWVRAIPEGSITLDNAPDFYTSAMRDYEFQNKFGAWLKKQLHVKTIAAMIGIRMEESLHRYCAIEGAAKKQTWKDRKYTSIINDGTINAYPIYDWKTEDIWTCYAKNNYPYNKLYDLFYLAKVPLHKMRVASPFLEHGLSSLHLYKSLDPNMWGKMVSRVNGVNFAGICGNTHAMAAKNITKPDHFTWKQYAEFLLSTLPDDIAEKYRRKLETSIHYWKTTGGYFDSETIERLKKKNIPIQEGRKRNYATKKEPIIIPEYLDDLHDPAFSQLPTYKRLCIAILKNDISCKTLGFGDTKIEAERQKKLVKKYSNL